MLTKWTLHKEGEMQVARFAGTLRGRHAWLRHPQRQTHALTWRGGFPTVQLDYSHPVHADSCNRVSDAPVGLIPGSDAGGHDAVRVLDPREVRDPQAPIDDLDPERARFKTVLHPPTTAPRAFSSFGLRRWRGIIRHDESSETDIGNKRWRNSPRLVATKSLVAVVL